MTNEELIAALEAADGPSRELDVEIAQAFFSVKPDEERLVQGGICHLTHDNGRTIVKPHAGAKGFQIQRPDPDEWGYTQGAGWDAFSVPPFTSSIDAALMLVPEGWWVSWLSVGCPYHNNGCILGTKNGKASNGRSARPALSIVIAALKAMEAANAQG